MKQDLVGKRFGYLEVKALKEYRHVGKQKTPFWICLCTHPDCGNEIEADGYALAKGKKWACFKCMRTINNKLIHLKHGYRKHPLYKKWSNMKGRCLNPNYDNYKSYGGRGITVFAAWINSAAEFIEYCIAVGWQPGLTIEREDPDGNYVPGNIKFIPKRKQAWNKTTTIWVELFGEKMSLGEAVERYAVVSYRLVFQRYIKLKWDLWKALTTPARHKKQKGE